MKIQPVLKHAGTVAVGASVFWKHFEHIVNAGVAVDLGLHGLAPYLSGTTVFVAFTVYLAILVLVLKNRKKEDSNAKN